MPLWKLTPIDMTDRNWAASTFKDEIVVRAADESSARRLAARAFGIATRHLPGEEVRIVPWDYGGFVTAVQVGATEEYAEEGPDEIVFPPSAARSGIDS